MTPEEVVGLNGNGWIHYVSTITCYVMVQQDQYHLMMWLNVELAHDPVYGITTGDST